MLVFGFVDFHEDSIDLVLCGALCHGFDPFDYIGSKGFDHAATEHLLVDPSADPALAALLLSVEEAFPDFWIKVVKESKTIFDVGFSGGSISNISCVAGFLHIRD